MKDYYYKIYYVDQQFGSDNNSGSLESPFRSLEHAKIIASKSDVIYILTSDISKVEYQLARENYGIDAIVIKQ